jgi:hypothetical protein
MGSAAPGASERAVGDACGHGRRRAIETTDEPAPPRSDPRCFPPRPASDDGDPRSRCMSFGLWAGVVVQGSIAVIADKRSLRRTCLSLGRRETQVSVARAELRLQGARTSLGCAALRRGTRDRSKLVNVGSGHSILRVSSTRAEYPFLLRQERILRNLGQLASYLRAWQVASGSTCGGGSQDGRGRFPFRRRTLPELPRAINRSAMC